MKTKIMSLALTVSSLGSLAAFAAGPAVTPALIEKGKASYTANCMTCHGDAGDGNGPAGAYMTPKPRNLVKDKYKKGDKPEAIFQTLTKGLPNTSMVAFAHLSEEERWALTHYVLSLRGKK